MPIADSCTATKQRPYSITSSARASFGVRMSASASHGIRSQEAKCVAPFRGTGGWDSFGVSRGHAMKLPADNFRNW